MISTRGTARLKLVRYLTCCQMRWPSSRAITVCGSSRRTKPGASLAELVVVATAEASPIPNAGVAVTRTSPRERRGIGFMGDKLSDVIHSQAITSQSWDFGQWRMGKRYPQVVHKGLVVVAFYAHSQF